MRLFSLFSKESSGEVKQAQQKLDSSVRNSQYLTGTELDLHQAFDELKKSFEEADLAMRNG